MSFPPTDIRGVNLCPLQPHDALIGTLNGEKKVGFQPNREDGFGKRSYVDLQHIGY